MGVKFEYNDFNEPFNIPKIIQSVTSEIPGGVMIKGEKITYQAVAEGTPVVIDSEGDYLPLTTDVRLSDVRIIGVLGENIGFPSANNGEDRLCRVITGGVIDKNGWKIMTNLLLNSNGNKYIKALTLDVEDMLAPGIIYNPPTPPLPSIG